MNLSLNEADALAKKAARGAGYTWGQAEDAGKAVRWMCERNLDGCGALASLLAQAANTPPSDWVPVLANDIWQAETDIVCPITAGAIVSDTAQTLETSDWRCKCVAAPALLIPFAAWAAQQTKSCVTLDLGEIAIVTDGTHIEMIGHDLPAKADANLTLGGQITDTSPRTMRARPDPETYSLLSAFAHKTYAPATEESRQRGAGAGLSDND